MQPDLTEPSAAPDQGVRAPVPATEPAEGTGALQATAPEPVYGQRYYATYNGGPYEFTGHWETFFNGVADHIVRQFAPRRVLDVGCAKGFLVHALRQRGVEAFGIDVSEYAVANALEPVRPYVRHGSMSEPIEGRYDLVTCIEAIEHVAPADVGAAVANLCAAADVVLLSSTGDGEHLGEPSHISMRPPEGWAALFAEHGFLRDLEIDVDWLTAWAMVLRRQTAPTVPEVVRAYDRRLARYQREVHELRNSALTMERELEALQAGQETRERRAEAERLQARAAAALTETLRLRDLLIVAERSLGQVQGEAALMHDQLAGYDDLLRQHQDVVNSTTWRLAWKVMGPYRRVRTRIGI